MRASDWEPHKTGNIHNSAETISVFHTHTQRVQVWVVPPVTQNHNQKLLPPPAPFILLPALIEGEMSQRSHGEQN